MSIQCKIIRNTTPRSGEAQDMATARAVSRGTYDFDQMCNDISEACSLTPADVTAAMADAAKCPVKREIPEKVKTDLDNYLGRKRKEN